MTIEYIDCVQGTSEWLYARLGVPTASCFDDVMTKAKKPGEKSKVRQTYLYKLVGELITNEPQEQATSKAMERGHLLEPEARDLYAMVTGTEPQIVGFARRTFQRGPGQEPFVVGASPDSLVGDDGLLEIKTKAPHILIPALLDGVLPDEHRAQVQGQLWVTDRQWCDFVAYWPALPLLKVRVQRDEAYIAELKVTLDEFCADRDRLCDRIIRWGFDKQQAAA